MDRNAADIRRRIRAEENAVIDVQFALLDILSAAGISKKELAERLDISKSAVSQLFAAGANPTVKQLARIFDALDQKLVLEPVPLHARRNMVARLHDQIRLPEGFLWERLAAATYIEWETSSPAANENYGEPQRAVA